MERTVPVCTCPADSGAYGLVVVENMSLNGTLEPLNIREERGAATNKLNVAKNYFHSSPTVCISILLQ